MAATDAVTQTAIARREVRASIERLEYHLSRGPRGAKGVAREVRFLDALHAQTVRLGGRTVGARYVGRGSFGAKAAAALSTGRSASIGRMKSSLLADFAADSLQPVRDTASRLVIWKWTANASACPTCLDRHGTVFQGPFVQRHPSCLCIPQPVTTPGLRELTDDELVTMSERYGNPRYRSQVERFKRGEISRSELSGLENVNASVRGLRALAEHLAKGEATQTGLPAGISDDTA